MTINRAAAETARAFESAWATGDARQIAELFAPGAIFTAPTLERSVGPDAIARSEQAALDTFFRGSRVEMTVDAVTPVRDDVAIVHSTNRVVRDATLLVTSHAMFVLALESGRWRIAGWHNLVPLGSAPGGAAAGTAE